MLKDLLGDNFEAIMAAAKEKGVSLLANPNKTPAFAPIADLEALQGEKTGLLEQLTAAQGERDTATGSAAQLTEEIQALKAAAEAATTAAEKEKFENAIRSVVEGANVHDYDTVRGLLDTSSMELGEDGSVSGLAELVEQLKTDKGFLFKGVDDVPPHKGGAPGDKKTELDNADDEEIRKKFGENL